MKRIVATVMLVMVITLGFTGSIGAKNSVVTNPKAHAACVDSEGKWIESKECGPQDNPACGCLFHQIVDYIGDFFS